MKRNPIEIPLRTCPCCKGRGCLNKNEKHANPKKVYVVFCLDMLCSTSAFIPNPGVFFTLEEADAMCISLENNHIRAWSESVQVGNFTRATMRKLQAKRGHWTFVQDK